MVFTSPLRAGDVASMLLDLVPDTPCNDDGVACSLRSLVDYMVPATLVLAACVVLGLVLGLSFSVVAARFERARQPARRARKRVLSGPIHTDGTWVRLVEDEAGRRVVEVLDGTAWRAATRDLAPFALDVPVTVEPRPHN